MLNFNQITAEKNCEDGNPLLETVRGCSITKRKHYQDTTEEETGMTGTNTIILSHGTQIG